MKPQLKFVLFILTAFRGKDVNGLRCYVCSDEDGGELPCINFDSDKQKFIQQCSSIHHTCYLKTEGDRRTRSCETYKINDCKEANGVEYCFCPTDLCNEKSHKFTDITDDEDLIEGSGTKMVSDVSKEKEVEIKPKQNVTITYVHSNGFKVKTSHYFAFFIAVIMFLYPNWQN